jgi:hypothetical protein
MTVRPTDVDTALRRAMQACVQAEADVLFEAMVAHCLEVCPHLSRDQAEAIERRWLGLFASLYYDADTQARVRRLYHLDLEVML